MVLLLGNEAMTLYEKDSWKIVLPGSGDRMFLYHAEKAIEYSEEYPPRPHMTGWDQCPKDIYDLWNFLQEMRQ